MSEDGLEIISSLLPKPLYAAYPLLALCITTQPSLTVGLTVLAQ